MCVPIGRVFLPHILDILRRRSLRAVLRCPAYGDWVVTDCCAVIADRELVVERRSWRRGVRVAGSRGVIEEACGVVFCCHGVVESCFWGCGACVGVSLVQACDDWGCHASGRSAVSDFSCGRSEFVCCSWLVG
jgi:hypothetical protein